MAGVKLSAAARWAVLLSLALFGLRLHLARVTAFGDAEALYVVYALHPQPVYLDHPGLVGSVAAWLGRVGAGDGASGLPSPWQVHAFTAVAATLLPWLGWWAARCTGAAAEAALRTFFGLALLPEISLGLFALTPDLLLAYAWLGALGAAALAVRAPPGSLAALAATLLTALLCAAALLSKASGALLAVALFALWLEPAQRSRWRTAAPWAALVTFAILSAPLLSWEATRGFAFLQHRFVATQARAGFSLRNLGALVGGQLLYLTPPGLFAAGLVLRDLRRRRWESGVARLLWLATLLPGAVLALLCLWSRVAEPHWMAPAYLGLAVHAARAEPLGPRLRRAFVGLGLGVVVLAWVWVGTDLPVRALGTAYRPRYDLANDLRAWQAAAPALRQAYQAATRAAGGPLVVVGPHWTVCAQTQLVLGERAAVGCRTPTGDDFGTWLPERRWWAAKTLLFVTDSRFRVDVAAEFPDRAVAARWSVEVRRAGRVMRSVEALLLDRVQGVAAQGRGDLPGAVPAAACAAAGSALGLAPGAGQGSAQGSAVSRTSARSPAISSSRSSLLRSGFGVVSSRSP